MLELGDEMEKKIKGQVVKVVMLHTSYECCT